MARVTAVPDTPQGPHAQHARDAHRAKVERVARQLRQHPGGQPLSLRKRGVSHRVPKRDDAIHTDEKIDISDLDQILEIDVAARTCTAEPGVTFRDLVQATLAHGLVPTVVPELSTITPGGAVAGCSVESMSFRHGGFHDSCLEYEVITAAGEVLVCRPDNPHRQVFELIHGSFGTLGILSRLRFRLVPARPFVHVTYEHHRSLARYQEAIWRHYVAGDADFMDGILHSPTHQVLSLGRFVDRAPYTNRYDRVKVYHQSTAERREDYLTTPQYLFRYDRGVTRVHPRSFIGRLLFGWMLDSSTLLWLAEKLHRFLPARRPNVVVDLFIPFSRLEEYLAWHQRELGFFPLWCVPYRLARRYEWIAPGYLDGVSDELFIDLAIYGMPQPPGQNVYRMLEEELCRVRGIKTLISYNYYDPDTFWSIWNRQSYQQVKRLVDPRNLFRDLYDKTCLAARGVASNA
jgi:FAD/FMN-containing dehydrogenase